MTNPLRRTRRGDPAAVDSAAWNFALDAAEVERARRASKTRASVRSDDRAGLVVLVRNTTSEVVPRFGAVALGPSVLSPDAAPEDYSVQPCFDHVIPAPSSNWGVAIDRIAPGTIGRAQLAGVVAADVWVTPETLGVTAVGLDLSGAVPYRLALDEAGTADVLSIQGGTGLRRAILRLGTTARGSGGLLYAKIVAPSNNGTTDAAWTVDVYGATPASLRSPPTATAQAAIQFSASSTYWRGEVVGVRSVGGSYVLQKFLSLPAASSTERGLIGIRLVTLGVDNVATNFIVDVADVAPIIAGGLTEAFCAYDWGIHRGVGRFGITYSAAVVLDGSWTIGTNVAARSTAPDLLPLVAAGGSFALSSAQDSFTIPAFSSGYQEQKTHTVAWSAGAYVFSAGGNREATQTQGRLTYLPDGASDPSRWPGMAAIPSIPGAIDSAYVLLVSFLGMIDDLGNSPTANPITKLNPELAGYLPLAAGATTPAGTYNVNAYSLAVAGYVSVA